MTSIKYFNVENFGLIERTEKSSEIDRMYTDYRSVYNTPSFTFIVLQTWDNVLEQTSYISVNITPRTYERIIPMHTNIEEMTAETFAHNYFIELKCGHWESHHKDRLMLPESIRGLSTFDDSMTIKAYDIRDLNYMASARPVYVDLSSESTKLPVTTYNVAEEYDAESMLSIMCGFLTIDDQHDELSGLWRYYHDSYGYEFETPKRVRDFRGTNDDYFYVDIAIDDSYYILKVQSRGMLIVSIREFHGVDNTVFREAASIIKSDIDFEAMRHWLSTYKKYDLTLGMAFADLMRPTKKRAALLCDVDIVFTAE